MGSCTCGQCKDSTYQYDYPSKAACEAACGGANKCYKTTLRRWFQSSCGCFDVYRPLDTGTCAVAQLQINGANFDVLVALVLNQWAQIFQEKFEDWFGEKKAWAAAADDAYGCTFTASGNIDIVYNCDGIHPKGMKGTECPGTCVGKLPDGKGAITASCAGSFTLNQTKNIKCPISCSPGFTAKSQCDPTECQPAGTVTVNGQSQVCCKASVSSCPNCAYGFNTTSASPNLTATCQTGSGCVSPTPQTNCTRTCPTGGSLPLSAQNFTGYCCQYGSPLTTVTQVSCIGQNTVGETCTIVTNPGVVNCTARTIGTANNYQCATPNCVAHGLA